MISTTDPIRNLLDTQLLSQSFEGAFDTEDTLKKGKSVAHAYAEVENSISVLTDMKAGRSYISMGSINQQFDISQGNTEIESIWEDQILARIHPEDLQKKYRLELQFFQLLKSKAISERVDYEVISKLRMKNKEGVYIFIKHRILYLSSFPNGGIWIALCLYNRLYPHPEYDIPAGVIVNRRTGKIIEYDNASVTCLLTVREKEILQQIKYGSRSKEIASKLCLSINTVNRHRQNIYQKLNVTNAMEACRIADVSGLL